MTVKTLPAQPKVGMVSLGCPKALVDSERILTKLRADGYGLSPDYAGADVVYAKSWGALPFYGRAEAEWELRRKYRHFIVDERKMSLTSNALFSHCLPLRRNVKATDAVMDAPYCVALDEAGFIKTGADLTPEDLAQARWPHARAPHLLETSIPGVFAVGDVRCGSMKRVASAVGEGSIAVSFIHRVLQE